MSDDELAAALPEASVSTDFDLAVAAWLAFLTAGAVLLENVMHGPAQGCRIVFAGIGFGCDL
jgi:hypothetical protein